MAVSQPPAYYYEAYFNRGVAYLNQKNYDRGFADLNKTIELDSKYVLAYIYRGIAVFFDQASVDLKRERG